MRYALVLKLSGLVVLGILTSLVTLSITSRVRKSEAAPVQAQPARTLMTATRNPAPNRRGLGPIGPWATKSWQGVQYDVQGHTVRVRATPELQEFGLDYRYIWSIGVFDIDDTDCTTALYEFHDMSHPFAVPANEVLRPSIDQTLVVPLPAGQYRIAVGLLEIPPEAHRNGGIAKLTKPGNLRIPGPIVPILLTD